MRLTYYANACCLMEVDGFAVLTDPWLVDGAFEGSWCHFPPLGVKPQDLAGVDALFVSHVHPDHCCPVTLAHFPRDIPILVLDAGPNFLHRVLRQMGFTNLIAVKDGETAELGPFRATLYAPFTTHIFHESKVGNLIDCAAHFEAGGFSVMNFNDNTPDLDSARRLRARHGKPTVAQIAYNAAGPYPSCFQNLSGEEKLDAAERTLQRNFRHAADVARILEPQWQMPFAGAYVLGGAQWAKNACLGTAPVQRAAEEIGRQNGGVPMLTLAEGQWIDVADGRRSAAHPAYDPQVEHAYLHDVLSKRRYPHEADPSPVTATLLDGCRAAREALWARQNRFEFFPDLEVLIGVSGRWFAFNMQDEGSAVVDRPAGGGPRIEITMDARLLARIVDGRAHWNNAEVGCHVDFTREPDVYIRDFHTMMSFFTAPAVKPRAITA